jgi:non-ribosomal peptide synthetase component F
MNRRQRGDRNGAAVRLAEVLAATPAAGRRPQPCSSRIALEPDQAALLPAAAAFVQARLIGCNAVQLGLRGSAGGWRAVTIDVDADATVDQWLATVDDALNGAAGIAAAELLIAGVDDDPAALLAAEPRLLAVLIDHGDSVAIHHDARRLDPLAADALRGALAIALGRLAGQREHRLGTLSVLSASERANLLCRFQNGRVRRCRGQSLVGRLQQVVEQWPQWPALRAAGQPTLSYAGLWQRSGELAAGLQAGGVHAGELVAVDGPRSIDQALAVIALLRAGAAWLPLEPALPLAATRRLLDAAGVNRVLACGTPRALGVPVVALDSLPSTAASPVLPDDDDRSCACVIACAADRGADAIALSQRALLRVLCDPEPAPISPGMQVLHAESPGSSAALFGLLAPLLNGGCCLIHDEPARDEYAPTAAGLRRTLADADAPLCLLAAASVDRLVAEDPLALAGLGHLLVAGAGAAAFSTATLDRLRQALPELPLSLVYAPPECGPLAAAVRLTPGVALPPDALPIGRPLAETSLHLLAADGGLLPVGARGELHVGGCGVTLGHVGEVGGGRPRCVPDPSAARGDRLFRSGDVGRRLADGSIELCMTTEAAPTPAADLDRIDLAQCPAPVQSAAGAACIPSPQETR